MQKIIVLTLTILIMASPAFAQESVVKPISFAELQASEPAILSGNPMYFLKEVRWSFQRWFISSDLKELSLKASILAEKAAELKKTDEIAGWNSKVVTGAMEQYQQSLVRYKAALKKIATTGDRQLIQPAIVNQLVLHLRLTSGLASNLALGQQRSSAEQVVLIDIMDQLAESIVVVAEEISSPALVRAQIQENAMAGSTAVARRTAEILARVQDKAASLEKIELANELRDLIRTLQAIDNQ
ncbi:MAG: hypothetical protein COU11_02795 [Candidatus Harrisonbacteria bacterium CG10_big_fil_rev_8_21_14_0_10_49_15]|uniref:DUF5667 domain-containing protein n=1 Tax=Candidatus Harrisonbacteria bacterium CG10_big_fil_rev_8_21_14_0_10_49_15 TaxID=1974587 RepID=A0A2H0UL46_9BACT|nr:MAG: hypothetical protein COU11_02795 [Candidatus Harrisonbacteria bacterium CG10_big_fil_rev_8_21_14_0_10_49_15]